MPKGPHELRLDTYVANGNVDNIAYSSHMWERGHTVLNNLADALESAKPHLLSRFGPQTGPAAVAAFETVAKNVRAQAAEMKRASTALTSAGHALEDAQHTHHSLGNAPAAPPADPTQKAGESAGDFHTRQHAAHQAQSGYAAEYADRERRAQTAITTVDTHYTQAIKVMESIHGQPPSHTGGGGGGGGGSIPTATLPGAGHHSAPTATGVSWATGQGSGHHHHVDPPVVVITDPTDPSTDPGHDGTGPGSGGEWPPGEHPGVPQGPGQYPPGTYPPGTYPPGGGPDVPPGGSLPPGATSTGPSSTMVGGLMTGGLVGGASGLSNALRGSAVTSAMTEEESLAATRAGSTGAAGGRGASAGAAGTSRGSGGRGTGAGGRGDRGRKKKRAPGIDFFEDNEDWLDEEEASPPVLH